MTSDAEHRAELARALGHRFTRWDLLECSLRHRSWCAEHGVAESNERLEFLGDSVLGLVMTARLYEAMPTLPEGQLAQRRAALVNSRTLAEVARSIDLGRHMLLGRGESATGGAGKASILADALEAVFAAVYLDGGIDAATTVILSLMAPWIDPVVSGVGVGDSKSQLQEWAARHEQVPEYQLDESGPDHDKRFTATVAVGDLAAGAGAGRSKKEAEQAAAAAALAALADPPLGCAPHDVADPLLGDPSDSEAGSSPTIIHEAMP